MSFFNKKKRFSEVEGYERISRLIEDRQRDSNADGAEGDDLEEETVLLAPPSRAAREPSGAPSGPRARRDSPKRGPPSSM